MDSVAARGVLRVVDERRGGSGARDARDGFIKILTVESGEKKEERRDSPEQGKEKTAIASRSRLRSGAELGGGIFFSQIGGSK